MLFRGLELFILIICVILNGILAQQPQPFIAIHNNHIGLSDNVLQNGFQGPLATGRPYTLDISMGNTDQFDYIIERCVYNQMQTSFIGPNGCLQRSSYFTNKWESQQYATNGLKRTLIYFTAPEEIVQFRCSIKPKPSSAPSFLWLSQVRDEKSGHFFLVSFLKATFQRSCEQRPLIQNYPVFVIPLSCCGGTTAAAVPPLIVGSHVGWWPGIVPLWLWILILILFLLLLCLCLSALIFWLFRQNSYNQNRVYCETNAVKSTLPPVVMTPVSVPALATIPAFTQTRPENRETAQQTYAADFYGKAAVTDPARYAVDSNIGGRHRTFDQHESISLRDNLPAGTNSSDQAKTTGFFDRLRHPNPNPQTQYTNDRWEEREEFNESIVDINSPYENYPTPVRERETRTRFIDFPNSGPSTTTTTINLPDAQRLRLQRELEDRFERTRRPPLRSRTLDDDQHDTEETYREETVRTIRQY